MLSKLIPKYVNYQDMEKLLSCLQEYAEIKFGRGKNLKIEPLMSIGGTLGIFFLLSTKDKKLFIKTHQNTQECKNNLNKEYDIMFALYSNIFYIENQCFIVNDSVYYCIIMDYLEQYTDEINCSLSQSIIDEYGRKLSKSFIERMNLKKIYTFFDVIDQSEKSLDYLKINNILSSKVVKQCQNSLKRVKKDVNVNKFTICHGDLSSVNIMVYANKEILIDWEDTMLGPSNYDFYYWLTFFSQRKYYNRSYLESIRNDLDNGKDLMIIILLVKSMLSHINKSYLKNTLSIEERFDEVFEI
ncbi:MAG: phosphotransferase [Fusobacteriaceae bacterium]|jgi:hypothetical protein|nr:phosphotransferase [Fusobacteriaceae bacterium]